MQRRQFVQGMLAAGTMPALKAIAGKGPSRKIPQLDSYHGVPTLDLSADTSRQCVVAQGTADVYQGHPTTLLSLDAKTIYAVWTIGHGGTCGPLKKTTDEGRSWSALLPTPANWPTAKNCPALYRLPQPNGGSRVFVYAGNGPDKCMQYATSDDDCRTWSPMQSNHLEEAVMPFCSIVPVDGSKRLLGLSNIRRPGEKVEQRSNVLASSISEDGGRTWTPWKVILDIPGLKPCEPAAFRSPDGKQILCLIRENVKRVALYMTSEDEGKTWSKYKPLPPGLWGDRHMPRYTADGRIVVTMRDTGAGSPTGKHFIAWVGRYEDILSGKDGQYRVKLLHSYHGGDCGYSGLEVLPDRNLVATTYIQYRPGKEKNSVVSVRFNLAELDAALKG